MQPIDIATAEHYCWGEGCDGWHLLKRDDLSVIQERVPPGAAEQRHFHNCSRQFFYVLQGEAVMAINDTLVTLQAGQGIEVPPKVPHQFRNCSDSDVVFLVISAPKSHGDRVEV